MSIADKLRSLSELDDCKAVCLEWHRDRGVWSCMAILGYDGKACVSPVLEDCIESLLGEIGEDTWDWQGEGMDTEEDDDGN